MTTSYLQAIQEVKIWLVYKKMEEFVYLLVDNGYDDLSAIAECTDEELNDFENLFRTPDSKRNIRMLVECLQEVGIHNYRNSRVKFRELLKEAQDKYEQEIASSIQSLKKEDYISMRRIPMDHEWNDHFFILEGSDFKHFKSKKNPQPDGVLPLAGATIKADETDICKLRIVPHISADIKYTSMELSFASVEEAQIWSNLFHLAKNAKIQEQKKDSGSMSPRSEQKSLHTPTFKLLECSFNIGLQIVVNEENAETDARASLSMKRNRTLQDRKSKTYMKLLNTGALFKKYKQGKAPQKRLIWFTPNFEYLLWGDPDKSLVRGFLRTKDISTVNQGFAEQRVRLFVTAPSRTLEIEARNTEMAKDWCDAIEFVIKVYHRGDELRNKQKNEGNYQQQLQAKRQEYVELLVRGEIFKKWPHTMGLYKSTSVRRVFYDANTQQLLWGEISTNKVKGDLPLSDVVQIIHDIDAENDLKFAILAMDRTLYLEAKNTHTKDKWCEALQFLVDC